MVGMVLVFILETTWIIHVVAPSYQGEQLALAVELTRIFLPSMIFGTLMGVLVGINNVNNSFINTALWGI
ncbi:MAG: lipid II flippase MurJ [Clostridiaceae bacterium]